MQTTLAPLEPEFCSLMGGRTLVPEGPFNNAGHPKIVPRSRKTLDFSRALGVVLGGSVFHEVVVVVLVVLKMFRGAQGWLRGQRVAARGRAGEHREAVSRQLVVASSSSSSSSSSGQY